MVETIRLESGHTLTGIVGSNPTLSASLQWLTSAKVQNGGPSDDFRSQDHFHDLRVDVVHLLGGTRRPPTAPEPGTLALLATGLAGIAWRNYNAARR